MRQMDLWDESIKTSLIRKYYQGKILEDKLQKMCAIRLTIKHAIVEVRVMKKV